MLGNLHGGEGVDVFAVARLHPQTVVADGDGRDRHVRHPWGRLGAHSVVHSAVDSHAGRQYWAPHTIYLLKVMLKVPKIRA